MAKYEHLKIYKKAFELTIYFEKIVKNFSRYNKYTLGKDLRDSMRKILKLIIKANSLKNKLECLIQIREEIEELKIIIRICKEVKAFNNFNSYEFAIKEVANLSRQNEGWIKYSRGAKQ